MYCPYTIMRNTILIDYNIFRFSLSILMCDRVYKILPEFRTKWGATYTWMQLIHE